MKIAPLKYFVNFKVLTLYLMHLWNKPWRVLKESRKSLRRRGAFLGPETYYSRERVEIVSHFIRLFNRLCCCNAIRKIRPVNFNKFQNWCVNYYKHDVVHCFSPHTRVIVDKLESVELIRCYYYYNTIF